MILYAVPAWSGFLGIADKVRFESVIKKAQRYGYVPSSCENEHSIVDSMQSKLFHCVLSSP